MRPEGHIRQRSPGSYEVRYCVGRDGHGKWRWATFTVKGTKKEARAELRRRLDRPTTAGKITVGQWLELWLETVRQEVSPKTHERYTELVQNFLVPALGSVPLAKLGPLQVQPVYNSWAIGGRLDGKPGGLAPRTRHHLHRVLKSALSRAVADQLLLQNPLDRRRWLPKVERQPMTILTPEQSQQLLGDLRHTRMYWPTLLALTTGMRRGETLALKWKNVDLKAGVVRVVESLEETRPEKGRATLRFKPPKSGHRRAVTLPKFALEELRKLKGEQGEELMGLGVRQTGESLVCGRWDGAAMVPESLTHEFSRLVGSLGLKVTFHGLRHSHTSHLLKTGAHPKIVQERLGHSTIAITMDLYSHLMDGMEAGAATKIDELFKSIRI
jgi:integrase